MATINVTYDFIAYDDVDGKYATTSPDSTSVFTDFMVHNRYEEDRGVYMNGLTSPTGLGGSTVGIVKLHASTMVMISEWTACRLGSQPWVPDPETLTLTGWTLLDVSVRPAAVSIGPSGNQPIYRISGVYVYVRNAGAQDSIYKTAQFPQAPWVQAGAFGRTIPADNLKDFLIGAPGGGGKPPGGPDGRVTQT